MDRPGFSQGLGVVGLRVSFGLRKLSLNLTHTLHTQLCAC